MWIMTASHPQNRGILLPLASCKLKLYCSPCPGIIWDSLSVPVSPSQKDPRFFLTHSDWRMFLEGRLVSGTGG